jgi:hypothetical protein
VIYSLMDVVLCWLYSHIISLQEIILKFVLWTAARIEDRPTLKDKSLCKGHGTFLKLCCKVYVRSMERFWNSVVALQFIHYLTSESESKNSLFWPMEKFHSVQAPDSHKVPLIKVLVLEFEQFHLSSVMCPNRNVMKIEYRLLYHDF